MVSTMATDMTALSNTSGVNDASGMPITRFTLKNLAAEEFSYEIGPDMNILGHLRKRIHAIFGIPFHLQRYVVSGRSYRHHDDDIPLTTMLKDTVEGESQERIIWLIWMRQNDYILPRRGGMFLESEHDAKREAIGEYHFAPIRLSDWSRISDRLVSSYCTYRQAVDGALRYDDNDSTTLDAE